MNKLNENQLFLIRHLCEYETLDYQTCLLSLNSCDKTAASYAFRPLTKNKYISKHKDGSVHILAKGRALFQDIKPLVTLGGGSRERINSISRTAMFLKLKGYKSLAKPDMSKSNYFIPSACWRKFRHGILSTVKFTGMLCVDELRLAVYDIGDGKMDWQIRAERSLFYPRYGEVFKTTATGMLLICDEDKRVEIAKRIIRETMWHRRRLILNESYEELFRPVKYSKAPIRLAHYYDRVYLTTSSRITKTLSDIREEQKCIRKYRGNADYSFHNDKHCDFYSGEQRVFVNLTTDLLKYVYFFTHVKDDYENGRTNYALLTQPEDVPIAEMYPKLTELEGLEIYEY
jgi:hypothetical protein